jgi:hypothetical protein
MFPNVNHKQTGDPSMTDEDTYLTDEWAAQYGQVRREAHKLTRRIQRLATVNEIVTNSLALTQDPEPTRDAMIRYEKQRSDLHEIRSFMVGLFEVLGTTVLQASSDWSDPQRDIGDTAWVHSFVVDGDTTILYGEY